MKNAEISNFKDFWKPNFNKGEDHIYWRKQKTINQDRKKPSWEMKLTLGLLAAVQLPNAIKAQFDYIDADLLEQ